MRNGQNKRMRGRNRKSQNPLTRVYESNGPDVKVRGTANHVAEKYLQLARDALTSGDPVGAESYYQHAEHYFRLIAAVNEQYRQQNPNAGDLRDNYDDDDGPEEGEPFAPREPYAQPQPQEYRGDYQPREPRDNRDYRDNRDNRDNRDRDQRRNHRDNRDNRGRDRDNRFQNRERNQNFQNEQPRLPPQDEPALDQLPAFVTGGAAASAPQENGHDASEGANAFEGAPDRFPLHRRRRRRPGAPRENAGDTESASQD